MKIKPKTIAAVFLVFYLSFAFVLMNANVTEWSMDSRVLFVVTALATAVFIVIQENEN